MLAVVRDGSDRCPACAIGTHKSNGTESFRRDWTSARAFHVGRYELPDLSSRGRTRGAYQREDPIHRDPRSAADAKPAPFQDWTPSRERGEVCFSDEIAQRSRPRVRY